MGNIPSQTPYDGDDGGVRIPAYAVVGRQEKQSDLPSVSVEALVKALTQPIPPPTLSCERKQIVALTTNQYLSVAELSAHLQLPIGVVQILVADLIVLQCVALATEKKTESANDVTMELLESVLNGISAL